MRSLFGKLFRSATGSDAEFWGWFAQQEARLAAAVTKGDPMPLIEEITGRLSAHEPELIAEIAIDPERAAPTLVISADGDQGLFAAVQRMVAAAPRLSRWKVVAFRPRQDPELVLELEGSRYSDRDFFFRQTGQENGKLDIEVLVRGLDDRNREVLEDVAFIQLDRVLGEFDVETRIGAIEVLPLPPARRLEIRPLAELASAVDAIPL